MRNEIVVGLDDSPSSKAALHWAADQARNTDAVLRAVHALDWPVGLTAVGFPAPVDFMELSPAELEDSYRQKYDALFDSISPRLGWILQFASGKAGQVLVQQSKDARLLVVGTREHVGLERLMSGSVSHYCLSHAACPVVAVPRAASDRSAEEPGTAEPDTTDGRVMDPIGRTQCDAADALPAAPRATSYGGARTTSGDG